MDYLSARGVFLIGCEILPETIRASIVLLEEPLAGKVVVYDEAGHSYGVILPEKEQIYDVEVKRWNHLN